jgi:hypothetical protein
LLERIQNRIRIRIRIKVVRIRNTVCLQVFFSMQGPQSIQVQGIKRFCQSSMSASGLIAKKVIIATINGTQRILTPVSSPQMIALKSAPRLLADGTLVSGGPTGGGAPITILQKTLSQQQQLAMGSKPKPMMSTQHLKPVNSS